MYYQQERDALLRAQEGIVTPPEITGMNFKKPLAFGMPASKTIPLGFNLGLDQDDLYNLRYNVSARGQSGDDKFSIVDPRHQLSLSLLDGMIGKGRNLNVTGVKSRNSLDLGLTGSTPLLGGNLSVSGNYNYTNPNNSSDMDEDRAANFMRVPQSQNRSNFGVNAQWQGKLGKKGPNTKIGFSVGNSGNVQMKNGGYMQQGGQQDQIMQIIQAYAQMNQIDPKQLLEQFTQMAPEQQKEAIMQMAQSIQQGASQQQPDMAQAAMAYGGYTTGIFAGGGEMIRRADGSYSKRGLWDNIRANRGSGKKPTKQMLEQEKEIRKQEAAYGGVFGNGGTNNAGFDALPDYVQAKILSNMGYGGYYDPMQLMDQGGEPNGSMALGQMSSVADKMSKLREFISPEQNLDPWIASKLAVMDHSADAISDYMMYNPEAQGEEMEMEEEMRRGGSTFSGNAWYRNGGINIDPAKRGTFKAQATRMGMGVQEAASAILGAPEGRYSPAMRKKANFAKNFAKQMGGLVEGDVLDVTPEQLQMLKQGGYNFEIID